MPMEARLVIVAEDRASAVLAKLEKRIEKMGGQFKTLDRVAGEALGGRGRRGSPVDMFARLEKAEVKLAGSIDRMTRAVDKLDRSSRSSSSWGSGPSPRGGSSSGHGGFSGIHAIGLGAGFEAAEIAAEIKKASFDRGHEEARMVLSGMTASEIAQSRLDAAKIAASMPAVGMNEILHESRNARAVIGSSAEAAPLMADLVRLRVIAQAQKPDQDVTQDMDQLVKGLEIKGVTQNPKKFHEFLNGVAKGLSVFGDTLSAGQFYQMFLYGRQATPMLSEKFMLGTAPTLAQELKGSSYGRAVSAFNRAIVGGRMMPEAAKQLQHIGLIGEHDLTKGGSLKQGKSVAGWQLAQTDPNAWVRQYLLPAMDSHGIKDVGAVSKMIGEVFSNQLAAQMVSILATQQAKIDKDTALLQDAKGLDGADFALRHDPEIAFHALKESLSNLGGTVGEGIATAMAPIAADMAKAIAKFSSEVEQNSKFRKANPDADSPAMKNARRAFNGLLFGVDTEKGIGDLSADEKLEIEAARRRERLVKWRNERETDPDKLDAIAERRKHVAPGFEASAKAQDDMDEFPMRAVADKQIAELDKTMAMYRASRDWTRAALESLQSASRFGNRPGPSAPFSPYITGSPTETPLGTAVFPTTRSMNYGNADISKIHAAAPAAPPPPPQPVDVSVITTVTAEPIVVRVEAGPELKATTQGLVGLRAAVKTLERGGKTAVGTSLPEADIMGSSGRGRL